MGKVFSDDVGLEILIDIQQDLTDATDISWIVKLPDNTLATWTPVQWDTTALRYITQSGDLSQSGGYVIQPRLTLGTWIGSGDPVKFYVFKKTS